jgi:hypothetical protein
MRKQKGDGVKRSRQEAGKVKVVLKKLSISQMFNLLARH